MDLYTQLTKATKRARPLATAVHNDETHPQQETLSGEQLISA